MTLEYAQEKINYYFFDVQLLHSALKAAHRSELEDIFDDGNRGLSKLGVCAVDIVETHNTVVVEQGTKSRSFTTHLFDVKLLSQLGDVDTHDHWTKSKRGRANACERLGLDHCVVPSVRQQHEKPSVTVLANAFSAIIGAVWLDMQRQNESTSNTIEQISNILRRVDTIIADGNGSFSKTHVRNVPALEGNDDIQETVPEGELNSNTSTDILDQFISLPELSVFEQPTQGQNDTLFDPDSLIFEGIQPISDLDPFGNDQSIVHFPKPSTSLINLQATSKTRAW